MLFASAGCHGEHEASPANRTASIARNAPAASDPGRSGSDAPTFVDRQMALRIAQFGGSLVPVAPMRRGTLAQGASASHDVEFVANHCYRILAVGGIEVNDLDLVLFGPDGSDLDEDTEGSDYPSLGTVRPICPPSPGTYRVEVRMRSGQGEYGLSVLRTP